MAATRTFVPTGGVTSPRGFRASGVRAGIKKNGNPDVAIVEAGAVVSAAGVFTTNKAQAAPVLVSIDHLKTTGGRARAVIVNAGCANACTGTQGMRDAIEMTTCTAAALGCQPAEVLVTSTGVIGVNLPMDKVRAGITAAATSLSVDGAESATHAIMTTDPFPKSCAVTVSPALDAGPGTPGALTPGSPGAAMFTVGGMCKGSGMIEPRMATMLGFITTDVKISPAVLHAALVKVVDATFNAITVDGECSTNDCVFILASGESGVEVTSADDEDFIGALTDVCGFLAREIVRGGEGATKLVTVNVTGAASHGDAWLAARTICNSPLVKTAIHGGDPNWGRLVAAAGRSGAAFDINTTSVAIGPVRLFVAGVPHDDLAPQAADELLQKEIAITVDLGLGAHAATMWTCDFSAEYVKINAEYRT
jgi:glutamate N-acetyltransferase/amino-acid N-acetyltransferase